jgi:hypothetical protein
MKPEQEDVFRICKEIVSWSMEAAKKGISYVFSGIDVQRLEARAAARNAMECLKELLKELS